MIFLKHRHTKKILKWLLFLVAFFVFLVGIIFTSYFAFEKKYASRIYPGIYIGEINLGGLNYIEAQKILNKKIDSLNSEGIIFRYKDKEAKLYPTLSSVESDLAYEIINLNIDKSIKLALQEGRGDTPLKNIIKKIDLIRKKEQLNLFFTINKTEIFKLLKSNFSKYETEAIDANLNYKNNNFTITKEETGLVLDYSSAIKQLEKNLINFKLDKITLESKIAFPKIYKKKVAGLDKEAKNILENSPLYIKFDSSIYDNKKVQDKNWLIKKEVIASWLKIKPEFDLTKEKNDFYVGFDEKKLKEYFDEYISPEINLEPQNAKFEIKDGRVVEFQESKDGLELNFEASFNLLENKFLIEKENNISLATTELKSILQTQDVNDLGINEIIGTGHSSFAGSPKNRRHNIATGASSLNGLIVKPGEELSLIETLGDIDKENGYLPELVIKGNETIAEYGGGLCQIGTTLFRTVLQSGLPVTMRRNHSYRVFYYEPAGTDATIYDPWPDFRFVNDTKNNILIQTRIEGDDIYFDFWGTKDGRIIKVDEPTIYNITKPDPTKLVETLDLPVGEKKCTEHAHNGADAYFDYTVTYPDETVIEKRFTSHYVPWREVCLIGVEKLSSDKEEIATSSEDIIE